MAHQLVRAGPADALEEKDGRTVMQRQRGVGELRLRVAQERDAHGAVLGGEQGG